MNREIKFRAILNNKWVYYTLGDLIIGNASYDSEHVEFKPETWTEYTGLKDKNGKEIYEGDILLMDYGLPHCSDIPHLKGKDLIVVKYELNYCEEYGNNMGYNIDYDEAIIIGNVYENPELLLEYFLC